MEEGKVYIAPDNYLLLVISLGTLALSQSELDYFVCPSTGLLCVSAAASH